MSDVSGTPRNPDHDPHDPDQAYGRTHDDEPVRRTLWRAFTEWVDDYAWTIIVLGGALILLDILAVLVVLLWQVRN